jgi:hypothetical protein
MEIRVLQISSASVKLHHYPSMPYMEASMHVFIRAITITTSKMQAKMGLQILAFTKYHRS